MGSGDVRGRALVWMSLGIVLGGLGLVPRERPRLRGRHSGVDRCGRDRLARRRTGWSHATRHRSSGARARCGVVLVPVAARNYAIGGELPRDDLAVRPQLLHRQQPALRMGRTCRCVPVAARPSTNVRTRPSSRTRAGARLTPSRSRATGRTARWTSSRSQPGAWLRSWTEAGAALERRRDARHGEPGESRRVVVAAGGRRMVPGTSACSCRWPCSASRRRGTSARLWLLYAMTIAYAASVVRSTCSRAIGFRWCPS